MQVMTSTAASAATQAQTETAKTSASTLDYNAFLGLLIAELKNQDPTKPMDSAQYIAQLASFSNVEQSVKANAKLDSLISAQQLSQAGGLIGRTVTSADGSSSGRVVSVQILDGGAVAELQGGGTVDIGPGLKVSA